MSSKSNKEPLDLQEIGVLSRSLEYFLEYWAEDASKIEALRQAKTFGIEQFYQLLLSNYMAFFRQSMLFGNSWANFDFTFSYGDLMKVTGEQADLVVLSTSDTFDFVTLAKRAINLQIAEREGVDYILSKRPSNKKLAPDDLVFVPSKVTNGLTYCFVPVFKQKAPYEHDIDPLDSRWGTQAVFDYLLRPKKGDKTFSRVVMQILGHGRLKLNDKAIVQEVWGVIQSEGKAKPKSEHSLLSSLELRVFSPRAVLELLALFVKEHERLELFAQASNGFGNPRSREIRSSGLVGKTTIFQEVCRNAVRLANVEKPVLIVGPRGAGKHEFALYMHAKSARAHRQFMRINCSESKHPAFEKSLFGYAVETRTGATTERLGTLGLTEGGTLFLEEITDLSLTIQSKLLRALEDKEYLPIGSTKHHKLKTNVLVSTSKDLSLAVRDGRFLAGLHHLVTGFQLKVPGLSDRLGDFPDILAVVTDSAAIDMHIPLKSWTPEAITALMSYHWPSNIDELRQTVNQLLNSVDANEITLDHLVQFAPTQVAMLLRGSELSGKSLRSLGPEKFWFEYHEVYNGRGKDMASAYGVTEGAVSQHKKKHEKFRPR